MPPTPPANALPAAVYSCSFKDIKFSVYLVKDISEKRWRHPALLKLLKHARKSYSIYGNVPLVDNNDRKSAVYLIRALYIHTHEKQKNLMEEWISIRFTPGHGEPFSTEDFSRSLYNSGSVISAFKKYRASHKNFVSMSRLCRITPRLSPHNTAYNGEQSLQKNKYTIICFALANMVFLKSLRDNAKYQYISGLFREELIKKKLTITTNSQTIPRFILAHKTLSCPSHAITLKRDTYAYSYPAYFLNIRDLEKVFKKIRANGKLTVATMRHYLNIQVNHPRQNITSLAGNKLGNLLTVKGKLKHSSLTGKRLRTMINETVADGPKLMVMPLAEWQKDITELVKKIPTLL